MGSQAKYCNLSSTLVKWQKQSGTLNCQSCHNGIVCPLQPYQVLRLLVLFAPHRMKTSQQCLVVADGLYMPSLSTDLGLTAFFFECTARRGRLVGSFAEHSPIANANQMGELLGLMSGHLVQLGVNKFYQDLVGKVTVFFDFDGTL